MSSDMSGVRHGRRPFLAGLGLALGGLALEATADGATCTATDRPADLTLPIAALGSVFLGAHDLRDVVIRTGVDEHTPGSLAAAASAFRTAREPWCSSFF